MVVVGRWYRIVLEAGGSVEGKVRSVTLPEGLMLNVDGRHRIWSPARESSGSSALTRSEAFGRSILRSKMCGCVQPGSPATFTGRYSPDSTR